MSKFSPFSPEERQRREAQEKASKQEPKVIYPDSILIDNRSGDSDDEDLFDEDESADAEGDQAEEQAGTTSPFALRLMCLISFFVCLVIGLGVLFWSGFLFVLAALAFFRDNELNASVRGLWKTCGSFVALAFGFALGVLNPTLGIGLLALYLSVNREAVGNSFLRNIVRRIFGKS